MHGFSRPALGALTALTMAIATFPQVVFGVLAADLILEFDVERWQIGTLVTATGVTGALLAPWLGRFTDRIGSLRSTRGVLAFSLGTLGWIALAPTYLVLAVAALFSGAPQGWSNSATNSLIVEALPQGGRGIMTGVKQSGVQGGIFLGGLLLPVFATVWGWRAAVGAFLALPVAGLAITLGRRTPATSSHPGGATKGRLPAVIQWITLYGVLSGLGTSAMLTFLPLFAAEDQAWTALQAGWLLSGVGLVGIVARISWGAISESWLGHGRTLEVLAALTVGSSLVLALAAADLVPGWLLIVSAVLLGAGGVSWNTVGMLAVMDHSPLREVGRGTGYVLLGFLLGYGTGAPILGYSVDRLGSYVPGWIGVSILFVAAGIVARKIARAEVAVMATA